LLREHHEQFVAEIATLFATSAASPALVKLDGVLIRDVSLFSKSRALC
jgi:hypothetical protein